jgi:thiol-disulfide isomerase/thioredoxin
VCRVIFEALFGEPFLKTRNLPWLIAPSGRRLELDGYNERLKLAFEHQGQQHFYKVGGYHQTNLKALKKRDKIKRFLCKEHGITLIEIPEVGTLTKISDVKAEIVSRCKRAGVAVRKDWETISIDLKPAYLPKQREFIAEFQELARARGGELLSKEFFGWNEKLMWKCSEVGHPPFATVASGVMQGTWCPKCAVEQRAAKCRDSLDTFIALARNLGGECLSNSYTNSDSVLEFRCAEGHLFKARAGAVKHGDLWCRQCNPREWLGAPTEPIETFQQIAKSHGGECLSTIRPKGPHKIEFKCENNHVFWLDPYAVKNGTWCPKCAAIRNGARKRDTIDTFKKLAKEKNGECLSNEYVNNATKLTFKCEAGHTFSSKPVDVKGKGSWCPICAAKKRGEQRRISCTGLDLI